ncbi:MAG TPA: DHA2 family efflux MFS transporter permease subunit [Stellaceae bacterium]|nr:DHA2 family efflux MFS transporter permease subunit [Stellaceae bacterium]
MSGSNRRVATAALMLATALQAADATIVNVALPQLEHDFGAGIELGTWIVTSYLCAAAVVAPLTGWLRRRLGPRRLYICALSLFIGASLLCALAPTAAAIVVCRAIQGAGGGVIPALSQAVLHDLYPRERHGRILAVWGAVAMVGPILGPAFGGIITDLVSWRWVFAINLPLGLAAVWGARNMLPRRDREAAGGTFDAVGLILLIVGVGALQLCLQRAIGRSWLHSPEVLAEAALALVALVVMAVRTGKLGPTIIRFEVFRNANFAAAAFLNFTTSALLFTSIVFLPTVVEGPLGYPATIGGLSIVPRGILMMLVILGAGRLIERVDYRFLITVGSLVAACGLGILAGLPASHNVLGLVVVGSSLQAMGAGAILMPLSTCALRGLPGDMRTDAAGLYSLLRQIGCACGVAVMSSILQIKLSVHGGVGVGAAPPSAWPDTAALRAYAECFKIMAIAAIAVMPGILLFRGLQPRTVPETVAPD